jgi:hypothetical protein
MAFTLIDAYSDKPLFTVHDSDSKKQEFSRPDAYIVDGEVYESPRQISIELLKTKSIKFVNNLTSEKIFSMYPQTKQANMQAQHSTLMAIISGSIAIETGGMFAARELDDTEKTQLISIQSAWYWIESVRAASNVANAAINDSLNADNINEILSQYRIDLASL